MSFDPKSQQQEVADIALPAAEPLGTRVYWYLLAQLDLVLEHFEFVHLLWHRRMEQSPVASEGANSSFLSNFLDDMNNAANRVYYDPHQNSQRPAWPSLRFISFALLVIGFVPTAYLAKAVILFFVLILVANLAKMFGDAKAAPTHPTNPPETPNSADSAHPSTSAFPPSVEAPSTSADLPSEKAQAASPTTETAAAELVVVKDAKTTTTLGSQALEASLQGSEFPSKVRALQAQYQGQLPSCLPNMKPTLLVCTKCQFSLNQYLEGCRNQVVDIEDAVQPVPDPTRTDSPHIRVEAEGTGPVGEALSPEEQKRQKKLKKKIQKKLHSTDESMTTGKILYQNLLHNIQDTPLESQIEIKPVTCLATCYHSNCIAFSAVGRHTYQFGDLDHRDSETVTDILKFAEQYITVPEGYTKTKQRPEKMKDTLLARIPPLPLFSQ